MKSVREQARCRTDLEDGLSFGVLSIHCMEEPPFEWSRPMFARYRALVGWAQIRLVQCGAQGPEQSEVSPAESFRVAAEPMDRRALPMNARSIVDSDPDCCIHNGVSNRGYHALMRCSPENPDAQSSLCNTYRSTGWTWICSNCLSDLSYLGMHPARPDRAIAGEAMPVCTSRAGVAGESSLLAVCFVLESELQRACVTAVTAIRIRPFGLHYPQISKLSRATPDMTGINHRESKHNPIPSMHDSGRFRLTVNCASSARVIAAAISGDLSMHGIGLRGGTITGVSMTRTRALQALVAPIHSPERDQCRQSA